MKKKVLFALWGGMFILCAGLGFIPRPLGWVRFVSRLAALVFFIPPALLLYTAGKQSDLPLLRLIRNLSLGSLGLTVLVLILNILLAPGPQVLGGILNSVLIVVSSPMICSGSWALSLFLWACLLMGALKAIRK